MLYHWYELGHAAVRPARAAAGSYRLMLSNPFNPLTHTSMARHTAAALEVFERTTRRYDRPTFRVHETMVDGGKVGVKEEVVWQHPFCRVVHFKRDIPRSRAGRDPRLLIVAPMSGHFATLLRGTIETFLPDHEVYITDWKDARNVPMAAGDFNLADYIDAMVDMFRHFGGDVHVFSVCQPSVPVLAAVALMEASDDPCVPHTMTLAGGPIDTRISPTIVNQLAMQRGTDWFRRNVITNVPWPSPGHGRSVYPGFLQLSGFMTMNLDRHMNAHKELFFHLVRGDGDNAEKNREFYDEYLAVMDLTAEFYLDTVDTVFVRHLLPRGLMRHRGQLIDPTRIRRVGLLTIEGEKDDITGLGQCRAAHDLCISIPDADKHHFECPHVGHYGIFNGSRFRREIAPRIAAFVRRRDPRTKTGLAAPVHNRRGRIDSLDMQRREVSSAAFTFSAAGRAPEETRNAVKTAPPSPARRASHTLAAGAMYLPGLAHLTMWQLTGSLLLNGLRNWQPAFAASAAGFREH
jgi:poly(3-hydroxybutyrate) depolymerase